MALVPEHDSPGTVSSGAESYQREVVETPGKKRVSGVCGVSAPGAARYTITYSVSVRSPPWAKHQHQGLSVLHESRGSRGVLVEGIDYVPSSVFTASDPYRSRLNVRPREPIADKVAGVIVRP